MEEEIKNPPKSEDDTPPNDEQLKRIEKLEEDNKELVSKNQELTTSVEGLKVELAKFKETYKSMFEDSSDDTKHEDTPTKKVSLDDIRGVFSELTK